MFRFKVRSEIARKQKDAEARQATMRGSSVIAGGSPSSSSSSISPGLERSLSEGQAMDAASSDELRRGEYVYVILTLTM